MPQGLIRLFNNFIIFFMARYDHLPVYKVSYELLLLVFQITKYFSREFKYTIGQELKKEAIEMMTNIYRAK
ncbi:hypothetical protein A2331_07110 [Candidatus Falkowbacteria bacterium RIFOXYB2_FULL_34_18]|uniref:Four helix bundle protein n=1 Tax=Candidatus Falkowbacteria bacterium RIFOXYD2_FULL_34_120 TaxID=1798007 RepID=A0A1F5TRX4_9BACT|nr:MAG: hypothetical protein A2331_07110 [Candidatus Falkowbacteria bacterium RIFOXYB2_FULL_34_18]OGF29912.1 MAG: hypothetical protein A2500_03565 [Candidatus Falkowbacteria bacterium RIFOXYC12_FULL_34_55]OGF37230.1 MAG: hypothetical protein A2466_02950 [Candidatus Falkowbacteria bacterium RIFOXYC2_FULL_34_220]OGF39450.1 MAG: hypothetical protein A2515_03940 [Candidatus Falkowbacteria bacterium RIFOXYD12_FULL_34_57]OGF41568.1 MAG: hypothetical protein A2531_02665 [Candidatus Falkowbacteria bact